LTLIFHISAAIDFEQLLLSCEEPFGIDDSYQAFLLMMFNKRDEEPFGMDDSYQAFFIADVQ